MTARWQFALVAAFAILNAAPAAAQQYPTRPVTVLVPFGAGGGSDLLARLWAQQLEKRLGKSFVIENRPGAGTTLAAMTVVRAQPDGYTLMQATSSTMAINLAMFKKLAYDPTKDLAPIALLTKAPFILVVAANSPVKSVKDLIALAKAKPNALNYGSGGPGSMHHLSTELLMSLTGISMVHVPYKGTPPAMRDLIAGNIQVLFGDSTSTVPMIKQGKVRALAVTTAQRTPALPDVPTVAETGVPGFESASWQMLVAPARTPQAVIALLNKELHAIFGNAKVQGELQRRGMVPQITDTPDKLKAFVKSEIDRWRPIVNRAKLAGTK